MSSTLSNIQEPIPSEYRDIAERLFPSPGTGARSDAAALDFARRLGVGNDFSALVAGTDGERALRRQLGHFRNNVELLIQKTWVEKADEAHKEKLLDRIPVFVADLEKGDAERALKSFVHILDELAYLLFGAQSHKADFIEYAFRIDPQIGLFWWYAGRLSSLLGSSDPAALRSTLLVGVCFLAAF